MSEETGGIGSGLKERKVWDIARKYGCVSLRYGTTEIYEILIPGGENCCVVVSDNPAVSDAYRRTAKTISDRCYRVGSSKALENVLNKLTMEANYDER